MTLRIYDTLKHEKRDFEPRDNGPVTLYVCGPTVYNYAHIGNARPVVVFDVLFRLLRHLYPDREVIYARNITDVDDKINKKAMDEGVDISVITNKFADIYNADMTELGALPPTYQPRATAHMPDMVALIEKLIESEMAYPTDDGEVLFKVAAYDADSGRYGKLSGRSLDDMIAGARVEVAENKEDAADFVLWKPSKPGEPVWDGPQGLPGRPGWHIECSAMSKAVLGLPIDIHGGGQDLIFPHHTNEIAQSCAAHGHSDPAAYARYWMHNGFLDFSGEKMSKSLGNVVLVHDLIRQYPGEVIRLALLSAHYRAPLNWTESLLQQTKARLDYLYGVLLRSKHLEPLEAEVPNREAMQHGFYADRWQQARVNLWPLLDDLNTPQMIGEYEIEGHEYGIGGLAAQLERSLKNENSTERYLAWLRASLRQAASILGILQEKPEDWFKAGADENLTQKVETLLAARKTARAEKNWPEADRIRDELNALNVEVMDSATGVSWKIKSTVNE